MEQRRFFRIRDKLKVSVFLRNGERLIRLGLNSSEPVYKLSLDELEDLLIKIYKESEFIPSRLGDGNFRQAIDDTLKTVLNKSPLIPEQLPIPELYHVSLSEGGIRIDFPKRVSVPQAGQRVLINLELNDETRPLDLAATLVGAENLSDEGIVSARFEFDHIEESDRQKLFRYIFKQQTKRING
ncbi:MULTISPECIES: PilZ domain-containing protein [Marinobacter]|jgi:hypothetical protein|uniref:Protein containing Type IV pilus assembly PilZ domain n=1 Tax=Marinobacter adhaerens (strain DSM 23420 / HP15) TaxID=225937 RepID=E4PSD6_MARAH|nr:MULTISPECIES: PilZ domain-containing protein [Marinobacter]ADQ00171.1 protein containing Type IV pilus assembly PilZ domain [Marinobacter adhaerens HP15]MBW4980617.1 PilZ domain-containing protein [Marinobacter adhaerens]